MIGSIIVYQPSSVAVLVIKKPFESPFQARSYSAGQNFVENPE